MTPDLIGGTQSGNNVTNGSTITIPIMGGPLAYNTTYSWEVNASDPGGNGTWVTETYTFTTRSVPATWWNPDWVYRKRLVIDSAKVDADLSNFPVLVDITDADVQSKAQSNGDDIVFTDYNGAKLKSRN